MAQPRYEEDQDPDRQSFFTTHGAISEENCKAMGKKYAWDYSHYELTRDPLLTHKCFYEGKAEFPETYGDDKSD